jgi:HD-GYP domain-containing protein (c-di-GMP phosphodiesterase class II)
MLVLRERGGRWFDPQMVKAAEALHRRGALWMQCLPGGPETAAQREQAVRSAVLDLAPAQSARVCAAEIDVICEAFAEVVDAKSHFTFRHSMGVTDVAAAIGDAMGLKPERKQLLHRAALLHDLGKLRIPNSILDKPGNLDDAEWSVMREHPALTQAILGRVSQFRELAFIAGAHHEKLDGTGYPYRLTGKYLPLEARILAVSDMYGAMVEDRPYRRGFPMEKALAILSEYVPGKLDADCFEALALAAPALALRDPQPQSRALPTGREASQAVFEPAHS